MLTLAIKKIITNKLLITSLFAGILIAVLIACTIPMYSAGIAHRMFVTQLETYQNENSVSPGAVIISCSLTAFKQTSDTEETVGKKDSSANIKNFDFCNNYLENELYPQMYMPALVKGITLSTSTLIAGDERDYKKSTKQEVVIKATENYDNAIEIVAGRMPAKEKDADGCVEVIVSRYAQKNLKFPLDSVIKVGQSESDVFSEYTVSALKVKIVGVFDYKSDAYNPIVDTLYGNELYCDYDMFYNGLFKEQNLISKVTWYFAGDYTKFDLSKTDQTIEALEQLDKNLVLWGLTGNVSTITPPVEQYKQYAENINSVNILLVLFYAPIMILIVFFIFMLSKFLVDNDKNEISMLTSRGASRKQILLLYLTQGGALALLSIIIAPPLALLLCSALGSTSGFLEFAQRAPMKISLSFSSLFCGALAGALAVCTMLVPVYRAAGLEIVEQKRQRAKKPIVGKLLLLGGAVISGAVAFYSYYVLVVQKEGLVTEAGNVQPLAYLLLICFFVSFALLLVLIYPLALNLIVKIRQNKWRAEKFSAFSRISRMEMRETFIVVFLTLTIAIGMFSSISARTLNKNLDNTTRYKYPCDIMASVNFYSTDYRFGVQRPFIYDDLENTDAMKVITGNSPRINTSFGKNIQDNVRLMGIDPDDFKKIVYWDDDILPKPMSYYLKLIREGKCILSKNAASYLGVKVGDQIMVRPDTTLSGSAVVSCTVGAVVNAWPTYYAEETDENGSKTQSYLVVLNAENVEAVANNQPYDVWMNTEMSVEELKKYTISENGRLTDIVNGAREVYLSETNSVRQATNGSLTLGFSAVILVCAIGFAIYWVLSIKSRTLQIGTMRALGMSLKAIYKTVLWEQLLLCVAPVILGIGAGIASGVMFAPLLQSAFTEMGSMPPYTLAFSFTDGLKLLALVALLIAAGTASAFAMLKSINAAAAIKLGED